jgi:hypothetical protein
MNTTLSTPGAFLTAPADGTIVGWRVVGSASLAGRVKVHVLRPGANGSFTGVGVSSGATFFDGNTPNPPGATLPIAAGDTLSLTTETNPFNDPGFARVSATTAPGGAYSYIAILTTGTNTPTFPQQGQELLFNATVELEPPLPGRVSPESGPAAGGTVVTIAGVHLAVVTGVSFGGVPATSFSGTNTLVTAVAPPHAAGLVDVEISTAGGTAPGAPLFAYLAPPDIQSPSLADLAMVPATFRPANFGGPTTDAPAARAGRIGAAVSYVLSEPATTTFTVERAVGQGPDCTPTTPPRRRRRCTRYVPQAGSFDHAGTSGANRFSFTGRLNDKALKPNRYRLVGVAHDGAGNPSEPATVRFRIRGR